MQCWFNGIFCQCETHSTFRLIAHFSLSIIMQYSACEYEIQYLSRFNWINKLDKLGKKKKITFQHLIDKFSIEKAVIKKVDKCFDNRNYTISLKTLLYFRLLFVSATILRITLQLSEINDMRSCKKLIQHRIIITNWSKSLEQITNHIR